ncbi:MAG: hypothetical protein ACOX6L_12150 [Syntrophomonadaceae bacterium]|jgi:hypothetical protein
MENKLSVGDLRSFYLLSGWDDFMTCPVCGEPLLISSTGNINFANSSGHMYVGSPDECSDYLEDDCPIPKDLKGPCEVGCEDCCDCDFIDEHLEVCRTCNKCPFLVEHNTDFFFCINGHIFTISTEFNGWYPESRTGKQLDIIVHPDLLERGRQIIIDWKKHLEELNNRLDDELIDGVDPYIVDFMTHMNSVRDSIKKMIDRQAEKDE